MSLEQGMPAAPSPEKILGEKIKVILQEFYATTLRENANSEVPTVFDDFDKPESVRSILEKGGIEVAQLDIQVKVDVEVDDAAAKHGNAYPGAWVMVSRDGKEIFKGFFEDPGAQYEY